MFAIPEAILVNRSFNSLIGCWLKVGDQYIRYIYEEEWTIWHNFTNYRAYKYWRILPCNGPQPTTAHNTCFAL
jgi:hypothetical protein